MTWQLYNTNRYEIVDNDWWHDNTIDIQIDWNDEILIKIDDWWNGWWSA